jgi:putative ABC transport system permease protein
MQDLKFALRSLLKAPGFTAVAVLIVALGIGAATAMFSTVNSLVLRPVALPESERLAVVYETNLPRNVSRFSVSYPNYRDWCERSRSWTALAAVGWRAMNLTGRGDPELVNVRPMTANFLPTLGLTPLLGRGFSEEEDRPGHNHVAIVTHAFWQRRFGGQADAIQQSLTLDGTSYAVVGVLPAGAFFPGDLEIAVPLVPHPGDDRRYEHELEVYGRLKPGITLDQADTEMKAIAAQLYSGFPEIDRSWRTGIAPLAREIVGPELQTALFVLLGAVTLLLLIACANLSNLLLVRASARAHELAIRMALGAGRIAIVRQIVTESFVVTLAGGMLGVLVSLWAVGSMRSLPLPRAAEISIDLRVLAAALAATVLAGAFAGLGPALKAAQARPQEALKSRGSRSGHRSRLRDSMVVAQLAISLTLLVGATLLGRSFLRLLQVNPGFNTENVLTVSLQPENNERAVPFYERVTERIAALPGVSSVGLIHLLPLAGGNTVNPIFPVGPSPAPAGEPIHASWRLVDGGYFRAMQIPVLRGRTLDGLSPAEARRSTVLSASFAKMLFGDADPIGRQIESLQVGGDRLTVVGVVGDVRDQNLGTAPGATFYWSMHKFLYGPMHLVVRFAPPKPGEGGSKGHAPPAFAAIRAAIKEIDPTVPVFNVRTLEELRATSLEQQRFILSLLGGFTGVALLLAALGTYGVIAFTEQQHRREIGIRIAVGAQAGDILGLVLGQGFRLIALGTVLGLAGALAAARLLSALLYGIGSSDLFSYLIATVVLALAAFGATLIPARRAIRVDPIVALRAE